MWELPNPFISEKGKEIASPADWDAQRAYLKRILAEDFYGELPPAPENVQAERIFEKELWGGEGKFEVYDISFGPEQMVHVKTAWISPASTEKDASRKPVPIVMCGSFVDEEIAKSVVSRGFALAAPLFDGAAPDDPVNFREGTLFKAYPAYSFKVIVGWGYLMSRVIDWVKMLDTVDPEHVVIAGHSRCGKAALSCAVYDERVSVCLAAGSGCGGMGSLRVYGSRFGEGTGVVETIGGMQGEMFPHWFLDSLAAYGTTERGGHYRENELRFDANFIASAIAPRPLLILEGLDDTWANPYGTIASFGAAAEVYHFLGADENLGLHVREGGHRFDMDDWNCGLDFCENVLFNADRPVSWHVRQENDPVIARSFKAPSAPEDASPSEAEEDPEARLRRMLESRWAFGEAGLEPESLKMMREALK